MAIPQKMQSVVGITVKNATFTEYSDIRVTFEQGSNTFEYEPFVVSDTVITVTIPEEDAAKLVTDDAYATLRYQIVGKKSDGTNVYTRVASISVDEIIGGEW